MQKRIDVVPRVRRVPVTMKLTINELLSRITPYIGVPITSPITRNKGAAGQLLETLTGIPHTSDTLDCIDGELKLYPLKKLKNGKVVPKETLAVTMLSKESLAEHSFEDSKCYIKMRRMLVVGYHRNGDSISIAEPVLVDFDNSRYTELLNALRTDYNTIRSRFLENGSLSSSIGKYLQTRTKGAGHGSTSRAFYLRPLFMKSL
jgi:DNA mismatch repair protein MutH